MTIFQLGNDPSLGAVLAEAAASLNAGVRVIAAFDEAQSAPESATGDDVIALFDGNNDTLVAACAALDAASLPRWAVIVCDLPDAAPAGEDGIWRLTRAEWTTPIVTRALAAIIELHRADRKIAQLRGDLLTFGHRVAHDLRTPLGGMFTTTEMLREILAEESPANAALTQPIIESGDGMVKLIERTSFFAKIAASTEEPLRWNMGTLFWNAFQKMEPKIIHAGAKLEHAHGWPFVDARASWLEAVWQQLITNALQHGGAGVQMEAGWTSEGRRNRYWLWSSTIVPPERRATLFYPFNRLHESRAPRGFGLALVRRIVEREGGFCGFDAPESGGSCFSFTLPAPIPLS